MKAKRDLKSFPWSTRGTGKGKQREGEEQKSFFTVKGKGKGSPHEDKGKKEKEKVFSAEKGGKTIKGILAKGGDGKKQRHPSHDL